MLLLSISGLVMLIYLKPLVNFSTLESAVFQWINYSDAGRKLLTGKLIGGWPARLPTHKQSCVKVKCLSIWRYLWSHVLLGGGVSISGNMFNPNVGFVQGVGIQKGVGMSRGWVCPRGGGGYSTPGHGTWDNIGYGWQADGTHANGMLSCLNYFSCVNNSRELLK